MIGQKGGSSMWIFRYFLPSVFGIALGIFVVQNLDSKPTLHFLFWEIYDVPLILIIAIAFVGGIVVRYYVIFLKWLEKKRVEQAAQKIIESRKTDEALKTKKEYSNNAEETEEER